MNIFSILTGPVSRMSHVERYSSFPVHRRENVAEHSWWVTFISYLLARDLMERGFEVSLPVVMERAMLHDLDESLSGDIIRSFKYRSIDLHAEIKEAAQENMREITSKMRPVGSYIYASWSEAKFADLEGRIVGMADMISVVLYCREEWLKGNRLVEPVVKEMYERWFHHYHDDPELGVYAQTIFPGRRFHNAFMYAELAAEEPKREPEQLALWSHREGPTAAMPDLAGAGEGSM